MESATESPIKLPAKSSVKCKYESCKFQAKQHEYCNRHLRYFQLKVAKEKGITLCRFFLRGCNNQIEVGKKTCDACLAKKHDGKPLCGHEGCTYHATAGKYCKLHLRDTYRDEEREKGIRYCNIARGCFTVLTGTHATCDTCRATNREKEHELFEQRNEIHTSLKAIHTSQRICVDCGKEFEMFLTAHKKESKRCNHCIETVRRQEAKRTERERNYKEGYLMHTKTYYKSYFTKAYKRGYEFTLTEEFFLETISSPCYYCGHFKEGEAVGIDRVNNSIGYVAENCVPCCEVCNRMKSFYHPAFFVEKAKHIANGTVPSESFHKTWHLYYGRSCYRCYITYKRESIEKRHMTFELTYEQWDSLIRSPCYLCGYTSIKGIGIDRVNNSIRSYSIENCRPCCGSCNSMKHDLDSPLFVSKCKEIDGKWTDTTLLRSIPMFANPLKPSFDIKSADTPGETIDNWQARTLYRSIRMGKTDLFLEYNKEVLTKEQFQTFLEASSKALAAEDTALPVLQKYLHALRQRRARARKRQAASVESLPAKSNE
jgi:hypothetical protein